MLKGKYYQQKKKKKKWAERIDWNSIDAEIWEMRSIVKTNRFSKKQDLCEEEFYHPKNYSKVICLVSQ